MLLGFATALRPRELVSIEKKHVARGAKGKSEGIIVHIPRLKADQAAEGQTGFKPLITWPILPHFASLRISTRSIGSRPPPIGSPDGPGWHCSAVTFGTSASFRDRTAVRIAAEVGEGASDPGSLSSAVLLFSGRARLFAVLHFLRAEPPHHPFLVGEAAGRPGAIGLFGGAVFEGLLVAIEPLVEVVRELDAPRVGPALCP